MASGAMQTKLEPLLKWVSGEAPAKFVVFASPIETVDEIRLGLERLLGEGRVHHHHRVAQAARAT